MDDARRLLELLRPAVERAEQIEQQQQAIADQIAKLKEAAEAEREGMITERANVTALREAAVTQAREEADAIIASARAEEETARARIAELLRRRRTERRRTPLRWRRQKPSAQSWMPSARN